MIRTHLTAALTALLLTTACLAQATDPAPAAAAPSAPATPVGDTQRSLLPTLKLPELSDIRLPMGGAVRAANTVMGLARQRLALVIGNGVLDKQPLLGAAPRDTQAVAAALRAAGFVVMVREGLTATDLRANLKEFRERLQPGGVGFLYFTGLGVQIEGQNYVLPRGLRLDVSGTAHVKDAAVPLRELVDAVQGTAESPRYLVVDAAYVVPALAPLQTGNLAAQKLPPGLLALYAAGPGNSLPAPEAEALPQPAPSDPRLIAASPFGRELVRSLITPRINGAEVLRLARSGTLEASQGKQVPFIDGDTKDKDEFAEPNLLDAMMPRGPEDLAREALKQGLRVATTHHAGELPVSDFASPSTPPATPVDTPDDDPSKSKRGTEPPRSNLGSPLNSLANAVADAAGTAAAGAAVVAATAAVAGKVGEAHAAAGALSTAVTVASNVASLAGNNSGGGGNDARPGTLVKPSSAKTETAATAPAPAAPPAAPAPAQAPANAQPLPDAVPRTAPNLAPPVAQALANGDGRTKAQQGGGERPAYVPRVNPFGYAEGDTFMYRVLDTWKNQVIGSQIQAIEKVLPDGGLSVNGAQTQLDPEGRVTSVRRADGSHSEYEPAQELFWSHPKRGESRKVNFNESFLRADRTSGEIEWKGSSSVGRPRKVQTPAGEFDVLPIETSGWFYEKLSTGAYNSGQWSRTVWYSPKLGHPVAIDIEDADRLGKIMRRERIELTHAQTSRVQ